MRPRNFISDELLALAMRQAGVVSREQCAAHGVSPASLVRMCRQRELAPVTRSVFSIGEPSWLGLAWAGVLIGGPSSLLGGAAAGYLHGICAQPDAIDVWSEGKHRDRGPFRFHRGSRRGRGEPPRVGIEDAALDLCQEADEGDVVGILAAALGTRRTRPARILERLRERGRLRNAARVVDVLGDVGAGAESALELRYLRDVERAHGLPRGTRQASVSARTRSDVVYEEYGVIAELDGRLGHEGRGVWRDYARDNLHAVDGWCTLRFGWDDVVSRPCEVARWWPRCS